MWSRLSILLLIVLVFATVSSGQVQVTLPDTTANWGGQITISVQVSDVTSYQIYSYEVTVKYDSLILAPVKVENQNTLTADWPAPVVNDATKGKLIIGGYGANAIVGKGRLVNIVFDVIGQPDEISDLIFDYFLFNNGSPTASLVNGRVKIITNLVAVTITTNVLDGTTVLVDGESFTAPYTTYWEKGTQHQISAPSPQTAGGDKRYIFQSWNDQGSQTHTVAVNEPTTFTANYGIQYFLSVQSSHGNPQGSGWYNAGTTAYFSIESQIIGNSNTRYSFASWTGQGTGSYTGPIRESSVVMNAPITEIANWTTTYLVDIRSPYATPFGTGWYQSGEVVNFGIDSTIINRSNAHYQFISWTGTGTGSYTGTNSQSTITVSGPVVEQANWNAEFLVETGSDPDGILNVPGAGWYQQGEQFTSIKAPDTLNYNNSNFLFKGWKVNDENVPGNPITISIDEPKKIIADYSSDITVIVTTSVGEGTKVIVDGEEKNAPFSAQWVAGSTHSIGVVSVQNGVPGTQFIYRQWRHGGSQTQNVSPTKNVTYIADLDTEYYLEVKDEPYGVINPSGSGWYPAMQVVNLDSIPTGKLQGQISFRFIKWKVDGVDSTRNEISILMDGPHSVIAVYQQGFYISGNITFVGSDPTPVTLNITGRENFELTTNKDGSYLIPGLLSGNYVVTLSHPDYRFEPTSRSYNISTNEEYQYYVAFYTPSAVQSIPPSNALPDKFDLLQNYPNPFSGRTMIKYQLKTNINVTITVYNILGQVVKQLVHFQQLPGTYQVEWNRTDISGLKVPAGIYFYRIEAGNFVKIKRMVIL